MTFADLSAGDAIFLDSNILTYHFQPHPLWGSQCSDLLQRIENREIAGFTSTHVLSEVSHRLMTIQASVTLGWSFGGIGNRLRSHPNEVRKLSAFRRAIEDMTRSNIQILLITPSLLVDAVAICQQFGLLTNDGLVLAVMQANGITKVASNDADFDRAPGVIRFSPA